MALEWREETCGDCLSNRDRTWSVKTVHTGSPTPPGYRVERVCGEWKRVAAPTRDVTLCLCDASE